MWAQISGSFLLTGEGFGSGPPLWSSPETIILLAPALPSVTQCHCSGAGQAPVLSWKPFPFTELGLWGMGYCPGFEKQTLQNPGWIETHTLFTLKIKTKHCFLPTVLVIAKQSTHLCLFIWTWEYALWDFLLKTSCIVCCFQGFRVHTQEIKSSFYKNQRIFTFLFNLTSPHLK